MELEVELPDEAVDVLLDDPELREALALAAYGEDLLRRLQGKSYGATTLVLWRRFAWVPEGSPKKEFVLSAEALLKADAMLRGKLQN